MLNFMCAEVDMPKHIIILGTGGNSLDILDTINDINDRNRKKVYICGGFLDDNRMLWGKNISGYKVLGPLSSASSYREYWFVNGIGSPENYLKKEKIISKTGLKIEQFETIIHPTASISKMARLGLGVVVFQHVTVTSNVLIGNHVIVLPNTVISHDDNIGDYTCITGGVAISGNVDIGRSCYIGTNSAIIGNISIGDFCLVGMGSVVLHDIPDNTVVVGNPAKVLRATNAFSTLD
jgi:sugar O-acyltransferase (sialic acid O-acetyltransferase NeuD family)